MNRKDTQNLDENLDGGFSTNKNHDLTKKIVGCAVLLAIVAVLQLLSGVIKFGPFSITLSLIPIIIGSIIYGPSIGALLGFEMGFIVLLTDSAAFYVINPFCTIIICIVKSTVAGLVSGFVYQAISKKNHPLAIILSALVCPIVNTGLFALGCIAFFFPTLREWAGGSGALNFLFISMIGINFVIEFVAISIVSPSLVFLIKVIKEKMIH